MLFQFNGMSESEIKDLEIEMRRGWEMERVKAAIAQRQVAKAMPEARAMNGLGRLRMQLDPLVHLWWRIREGPQVFKDKTFKRLFERDNPEVKVRCHGTKTMIGYGS
jgi:hypothetical protein